LEAFRFAPIPGHDDLGSGWSAGGVFNIEQSLKPDPGILTGTMIKNTVQTAGKEPALDELKAQQQLARVVSEVVTELENGTTQAMLEVCMKSQVTRAA
jgi:hypothetical protein